MKIIRDEEMGGIFMIPLLAQWGVEMCGEKDCEKKSNTIVVDIHPGAPKAVGLCEEHYQSWCNKPGGGTLKLGFKKKENKK